MADAPRPRLRSRFTVQPGKPIVVDQVEDLPTDRTTTGDALSDKVGKTLKAYRDAASDLVANKYPALREIAPPHMRGECDCLALICEDGIVIRWDAKTEEKAVVRVGRLLEDEAKTVAAVVAKLSEGFIHVSEDPATFVLGRDAGIRMQMAKTSPEGESTPIAEQQFAVVVSAQALREQHSTRKPVPVVSVLNGFTIQVFGREVDIADPMDQREFVAVGRMKLGVGWELMEVYPRLDPGIWDPDAAADRAELDLLAIAAQHNIAGQTLQNLDRGSALRREFSALLRQFEDLLGGLEKPLQTFLEEHPELLRPSNARVWKRLPLGDHVTDFVIREPTGDYLLVEIEAPIRPLFRKDGQPREELTHALNQISDWIEYIQLNLPTVEQDLGLAGIANPRGLIVIGRSLDLTEDNRAKLNTLRGMIPRVDILTYDDVLISTKTTVQNLLGTLPDPRTTAEIYYLPKQ